MLDRSGVMIGMKNNHMITTTLKDAVKQHPSLNPELLKVATISAT